MQDKTIVLDIDGVLCETKDNILYQDRIPIPQILNQLRKYKEKGFYIILYTSRNMNTYQNNIGKINANTAPVLMVWLGKYDIPYDEIYYSKPWCGKLGFYVDDKAIRPDEFINVRYEDIVEMLKYENNHNDGGTGKPL